MKLSCGGELTYCTNVHPGESWDEIRQNLDLYVLSVKSTVANGVPFGIGLRLSAAAAQELCIPNALSEFKAWLAKNNCYIFTINGFPFDNFHGLIVKERVYLPDWRSKERLDYTVTLADLLANLLPDSVNYGSISTVPVGFRKYIQIKEHVQPIVDNLLSIIEHLVLLEYKTGKRIVLALEPEPCCYLETISETIRFFNDHIFSEFAIKQISNHLNINASSAELAIRDHIGICLDLCHSAVEYEDPLEIIRQLRSSKIRVPKIQLSSSLGIVPVNNDAIQRLMAFDDGIYLHQVVERVGQKLNRYDDIKDAVSNYKDDTDNREWRIHFHVPIFHLSLSGFQTSQSFLQVILAEHLKEPLTQHLEIETYTWRVLPEEYRDKEVTQLITNEFFWVINRLQQ